MNSKCRRILRVEAELCRGGFRDSADPLTIILILVSSIASPSSSKSKEGLGQNTRQCARGY